MATQEFKPLALNLFNAPLITHGGPRLIAVFRPASGLTAAFLSTNRKRKSGRDAGVSASTPLGGDLRSEASRGDPSGRGRARCEIDMMFHLAPSMPWSRSRVSSVEKFRGSCST